MSNKTYILLKDLPNCRSGTEYHQNPIELNKYQPSIYSKSPDEVVTLFDASVVENNTDWFQLKEHYLMTIDSDWKIINPSQPNGEYMPEGTKVIMYSEETGDMVIDFRYSSLPKQSVLNGQVSHWMPLPKKPTE